MIVVGDAGRGGAVGLVEAGAAGLIIPILRPRRRSISSDSLCLIWPSFSLFIAYPRLSTLMDSTRNARWHSLPTEMKFAVMDNLSYADLKSLSRSDSATYHACVPALFHVRYFHLPQTSFF